MINVCEKVPKSDTYKHEDFSLKFKQISWLLGANTELTIHNKSYAALAGAQTILDRRNTAGVLVRATLKVYNGSRINYRRILLMLLGM